MKKLFLTLVVAFAGILSANAQVWVGGSASAVANEHHKGFTVAPEIGYSIPSTKWTVAVAANYAYDNYDAFLGNVDVNNFILSPYVRYSVCNIEKFAMFLDLTGDFGLSGHDGYRVGLQPGIAWMPTKHWTAAFRFAFIGYNKCGFYGEEGFNMNFATSAPAFGLYYNF